MYLPPEDEEWIERTVPNDPATIFKEASQQVAALLEAQGDASGDSLINRLVFAHQVTLLEAYLGDRLIRKVRDDIEMLSRLVENESELRKERPTLAEILQDQNIVETRVRSDLRRLRVGRRCNLRKSSVR